MKGLKTSLVIIITLFAAIQLYFYYSSGKIETAQYRLIKKDDKIEIRTYEDAVFASVDVSGQMFENQNKAFGKLANYIFGGNDSEQKIAMTAPVMVEPTNDSIRMSFIMPGEYAKVDLPVPNSSEIEIKNQLGFKSVSISFGGFANSEKYGKYKNILNNYIRENSLLTDGDFMFLGYNPPYQLFGRKNEVMIKLDESYNTRQEIKETNIQQHPDSDSLNVDISQGDTLLTDSI